MLLKYPLMNPSGGIFLPTLKLYLVVFKKYQPKLFDMIKKYIYLLFFIFPFSIASFGQSATSSINEHRIAEVYGSFATQLSKEQLAAVKEELSRSEIKKETAQTGESYILLSQLTIQNKYVADLKRDDFTKPLEVNPLKYAINFSQSKDQIFRIDGTDFILLIKGKK